MIADTGNAVIVSAASAWEIATKVGLGKLPTAVDLVADFVGQMEREGFQMLAIAAALPTGVRPRAKASN